jgi:hypothetical protein
MCRDYQHSWIGWLLVLLVVAAPGRGAPTGMALGVNVNESLTLLEPELLERAGTPWVRGFVPASEFIEGRRHFDTDAGLQALWVAADGGRKVILTIKWDLALKHWRVPAPDSTQEKEWFAFASGLTEAMRGRLDALALVNEIFVDTLPEDMAPDAAGAIPMLVFQQRLARHMSLARPRARDGGPLPLFAGGLTRLDLPKMQHSATVAALLQWVDTAEEIHGLSMHLHQQDCDQMRAALNFMRGRVGTKPVIVTEFSLVWRYKAHLEDKLGGDEAGLEFIRTHRLSADLTVRDYINRALEHPVPESEWHAFLASRTWFDPEFLSKACALMAAHGVVTATYGFSQAGPEAAPSRQLKANGTPWLLNMLYIRRVAHTDNPACAPVNHGLFADFVRLQAPAPAPLHAATNPVKS